jgi:uncharacterized protein YigE (DUF2233 family)
MNFATEFQSMNYQKSLIKIWQIGLIFVFVSCGGNAIDKKIFDDFIVEPSAANIEFYWKNTDGEIFRSIKNLKAKAEKIGKHLRFAMNGGMYQEDNKPLGLFVSDGKIVTELNTRNAEGNFYLKPNGVFYINDDRQAAVVTTENFQKDERIKFATQSGPMLLVDGQINSLFTQNSDNLYVRNGVCVLEDGKVVFSISRVKVNFYDFAVHFQNLGCRNALYLDGFVSRMYLPEQNLNDLDGDFGVIIGIIE